MKNFLKLAGITVLALVFLPLYAQKEWQPAGKKLAPQRIKSGTSGSVIEFPAVKAPNNMAVVLLCNMRLESPANGGWNQLAGINLNGKDFTAKTVSGSPRILMRSKSCLTTHPSEKTVDWFRGSGILVFFGPDGNEVIDKRITTDRKLGYKYAFDISDMVNYVVIVMDDRIESAEVNRLVFKNLLPAQYPNDLLVKDIQIMLVPKSQMLKLSGVELRPYKTAARAATIKDGKWQLDVSCNGTITVTADGEKSYIESEYSFIATPEMQFNTFGGVKLSGQKGISARVNQVDANTIKAVFRAPSYTIERTITKTSAERITVQDKLINTTTSDLGLVWRHHAGQRTLPVNGSRIAGQSNASKVIFHSSCNPTVFVKGHQSALGLVAEDTVSRAQLVLTASGNDYTMGSEGLGLPAGDSVVLDWAIYPLNGADKNYFDFINRVRRDWGVNLTVPGPYGISGSVIKGFRPTVAGISPWFEYGRQWYRTRDEYVAVVKPKMEKLRKAYPGIKLLGQLETNLIPMDMGQYEWGKEMPLTYGDRKNPKTKYGQFISPELTRKLDAVTPYKDSIIRDEKGNAMIDTHYVYEELPHINIMVQPEVGNYRYQTFFEHIDYLMDEVGFNGVYIDQFQPYIVGGFSEDRWDGRTVVLDKTGKIIKKRYSYAITGAVARGNILRYVANKGGVVVVNGHPMSREEQNTGVISFQEMEGDPVNPIPFMTAKPPEFRWQTSGHLASPIILGVRPNLHQRAAVTDGRDRRAEIINKSIITAARNGVLYYYYGLEQPLTGPNAGSFEVASYMFPFTPVELGEGVLKGKERTIAVYSGKFTVAGNKQPQLHYFNNFGIRKAAGWNISGQPGAWTVEVEIDDWNEIAIIEVQD